jgi:hypothetical protein
MQLNCRRYVILSLGDNSLIVVQINLVAAECEHFVGSDTLEANVKNAVNSIRYGFNRAGGKCTGC